MAQKVCVVFGFGAGIGAACARRWINEGFKVAIVARYSGYWLRMNKAPFM